MANQSMIQLDPALVDNLVKQQLHTAVLSALADKKDYLIGNMVSQILNLKVNENGQIDTYSDRNKTPWIEHTLNKEIRAYLLKAIQEQLQEMLPELKEKVKKEVAKSSSKLAAAIMTGLTENIGVDYCFNVQLKHR